MTALDYLRDAHARVVEIRDAIVDGNYAYAHALAVDLERDLRVAITRLADHAE